VGLSTGDYVDWDVVAAEPGHWMHLLPLAQPLAEAQLSILVIAPGEDLGELSLGGDENFGLARVL
jgi:hypothetical protein